MNEELKILLVLSASLGFIHTITGPDHYLPFIVLSKSRNWSMLKTTWLTLLCGLGHVGSSVVLGMVGIALGIGINKLEIFEATRGNLAAWSLIFFGAGYFIWGMIRAKKNKAHNHIHVHGNIGKHEHFHDHQLEHDLMHVNNKKKNLTPWILFTIFVLGPCEPLIFAIIYPAAKLNTHAILLTVIVFCTITILTMLGMVLSLTYGLKLVQFGKLEKYAHALAGGTVFLSGLAIITLGL